MQRTIQPEVDAVAWPCDPRRDPRPDLVADSALWTVLLTAAAKIDGDRPDGLTGALHGLRCLGAALVAVPHGGARLERGALPVAEWLTYRARYLMPHATRLGALLRNLTT